jgi:hypothetical protein
MKKFESLKNQTVRIHHTSFNLFTDSNFFNGTKQL